MSVTLFHVSDVHFGTEDRAALAWFAAAVASERPDAVLLTGDLTAAARKTEYRDAEAWLATLNAPVLLEPGNHDLPVYNPLARLLTPFGRFNRLEAAIERELALPGVEVIPLRTAAQAQFRRNWSLGAVQPRSLNAALTALQARVAGTLAIVTCHHPLVDAAATSTMGRTRGGADALRRLAAAGADAVLSGHTHDPFDLIWHGGERPIRLIGAGTLSERLRSTRPSFNRLTVDGGNLSVVPVMMP